MHSLKKILLIAFFAIANLTMAQSFVYSGPTNVTVSFGNTTATGTYNFTYSNVGNLIRPKMIIAVDDELITNDLCTGNDPFLPSSYNIMFTPGTHSIQFSLLSVDPQTLNCYVPVIWQVEQFSVHCNFKVKVKNIFENGIINVDNITRNSPYDRPADANDQVPLGAIDQDYNNYNRVWNTNGNNLSQWDKQINNGAWIYKSSFRNFTYTVQSGDINSAIIRAGLRKNFSIDQTHKTEFDGDLTQQNTAWIVEQNSGDITAPDPHPIYSYYNFAGWTDDFNLPNTRTITPDDNETFTALYKYPHHSNNPDAYKNNSQRKFIRTPDGKMYITYESMGYIWVEKSTDNGQTWDIMNDGKPLDNGEAKLPAIDSYMKL